MTPTPLAELLERARGLLSEGPAVARAVSRFVDDLSLVLNAYEDGLRMARQGEDLYRTVLPALSRATVDVFKRHGRALSFLLEMPESFPASPGLINALERIGYYMRRSSRDITSERDLNKAIMDVERGLRGLRRDLQTYERTGGGAPIAMAASVDPARLPNASRGRYAGVLMRG